MENTKAEAKAYNDMIKNQSIEYKLELLYIDLIAYVANELGEEKMEALKQIINTFKTNPYPWTIADEIEVILYGYNRVKDGFSNIRYFKADTKLELELVDEYYNYFYRDLEITLNKIIDKFSDWGWSLEPKVAELEAKGEL
ncbi:MAG: hypothetical protein IJ965_01625 [Campylobacter sp.]|nr:hypothetical protein [Campylobacter sp.]